MTTTVSAFCAASRSPDWCLLCQGCIADYGTTLQATRVTLMSQAGTLADVRVDPDSYEVTVDGVHATSPLLPLLQTMTYATPAYPSGCCTLFHGLEGLVQAHRARGVDAVQTPAPSSLSSHPTTN